VPKKLGDLADLVRSKNAGPFWFTFDVMFENQDVYRHVRDSNVVSASLISRLFGVDQNVLVVPDDAALAIKVSFPRPSSSGSPSDTDVYGGQQYAPLLGVLVPD
jgi:hypothetical protein